MEPIKLLIVDDHPLFRQGLVDVLETDPSMLVVGEAADGESAVERAAELEPDIILMDVNLPKMNGLQVTRREAVHVLATWARSFRPRSQTPDSTSIPRR